MVKNLSSSSSSSSSSSAWQSVLCKICMETLQPGETFRNNNCGHAFCRRCIRRYIETKVNQKCMAVKCPEFGCVELLYFEFCKDMLPPTVVARWTNALCKPTLHLSERMYCPFKDCSKLIWYDTRRRLKQTKCPDCQRLFCAVCMAAWHDEMSCEEYSRRFEKGVEREKEEDLLLLKVARDKNWQRCPGCKYFVEKINGCLHIVCRCGLEFCYGCGMDMSSQRCGCSSRV